MQITEFREHAENLGRFASVKEKAEAPADRVLIQQRDGVLKLVGGTGTRTVVISCGPHDGLNGMAVVSARLLLNAAKMLRGKGSVTFEVNREGAVMRTSTGGKVVLPNVAWEVPSFVRPFDAEACATAVTLPAKWWPDVSRLLTTVTTWAIGGWEQVGFDVTPFGVYLRGGDKFSMTCIPVEWEGYYESYYAALDPEFVNALRGFEDAGAIYWQGDLLMVASGPYTAVHKRLWSDPKLPYLPEEYTHYSAGLKADRAALANMVKGVADSDDEFKRVTLTATKDNNLTVTAWGGGQSVTVPAEVTGDGQVAVVSERLLKLLTAVGGKTVEMQWGDGPVIHIRGDKVPWSVYQSRVALA